MYKANEAPGTATRASPHGRLAWLPARQHLLAHLGALRTRERSPQALHQAFCGRVRRTARPEQTVAGTQPGMSRLGSGDRVHPAEGGHENLAWEGRDLAAL